VKDVIHMVLAAVIVASIAVLLAVAGLTAFAVLVFAVQATDHRLSLNGASRGRADAFARRVLAVRPPARPVCRNSESSRQPCA
jgi:hypothetical protein